MTGSERSIIVQRVVDCLKRNPSIPNKKIYSNVRGTNLDIITEARKIVGSKEVVHLETKPLSKGRTLEQFKKVFDVREKIKDGIKRMGSDCYMTDTEFREFCGVHINSWRRFADEDQFKAYRVRIGGVIHWAGISMIKKMKDIVGIYD